MGSKVAPGSFTVITNVWVDCWPVSSNAVTSTLTVGSALKSRVSPGRRVSWSSPSIWKRASSTVKETAVPSGSTEETVPMIAPATPESTVSPVIWGAEGASSTSPTVMVSVVVVDSFAASVAVISTSTEGVASKSSATPSFSFSWPPTTSKSEAGSALKVMAASSPSGSTAESVPITAPAAFSATVLASRAIELGCVASITSVTVTEMSCEAVSTPSLVVRVTS